MFARVFAHRLSPRRRFSSALFALLLSTQGKPQLACAGGEPAGEWIDDWHDADVALVDRATREGLASVARDAARAAGGPPAVLLTRLNALVRARLPVCAGELIEQLAATTLVVDRDALMRSGSLAPPDCPPGRVCISTDALSRIAHWLAERGEFTLLIQFAERFPQVALDSHPLDEYFRSLGYDDEQLDAWHEDRARRGDSDAALRHWGMHRVRCGRFDALFDNYCEQLRRMPTSRRAVERVLVLAESAPKQPKLEWVGETYRPACVTDVLAVASRLPPIARRPLLEWARTAPILETETETLRRRVSIAISSEAARAAIRRDVLTQLVECYRAVGEAERAQEALESLANHSGDIPPGLAFLAGGVQAASGHRVIESRILEAEEERGDSPQYWLTRAEYYTGRAEWSAADTAFQKALALAPPPQTDEEMRGERAERAIAVARYTEFLARHQGMDAAARLVRHEFSRGTGDYATAMMWELLGLVQRHGLVIDADDAILWEQLRQRPRWEGPEERLLFEVARRCPAEQQPGLWRRLESLADSADASRAKIAGWVMTRSNENARAVPLLRGAVERMVDPRERAATAFNLYEALRDTANWHEAAAALAAASGHLTPAERIEHLTALAVASARAGQSERALALWRTRLRVDWSDRGLEALAAHLPCSSLAELYAEVADACPASSAPAAANAILGLSGNETGPSDLPGPAR